MVMGRLIAPLSRSTSLPAWTARVAKPYSDPKVCFSMFFPSPAMTAAYAPSSPPPVFLFQLSYFGNMIITDSSISAYVRQVKCYFMARQQSRFFFSTRSSSFRPSPRTGGRSSMVMACRGHASTHRGSCPWRSRFKQPSHLAAFPLSNTMPSNRHAPAQARQPIQPCCPAERSPWRRPG